MADQNNAVDSGYAEYVELCNGMGYDPMPRDKYDASLKSHPAASATAPALYALTNKQCHEIEIRAISLASNLVNAQDSSPSDEEYSGVFVRAILTDVLAVLAASQSVPALGAPGFIQVPVDAYLWLMGMGNDGFTEDRRGAFWWRSAFNERAGLDMMDIYEARKNDVTPAAPAVAALPRYEPHEQILGFMQDSGAATPADPEQAKLDSLAQAGLAAALESRAKGDAGTVAWKSLSDAQWVTIVNSCHGYVNMSTEDAVHTAVKMTEEKLRELNAIQPKAAPEATSEPDEPTDREQLIACLGDDAATLIAQNPDDEMAQTMLDAAAMLEAGEQMGDAQVAIPGGWTIERTDKPPFRSITVKSPAGKVALLSNIGRNPENVFYEFVDALLTAERAAEEQATERKPLTIVEAKAEAAAPEAPDDAQGTPYFRDVEFDPPSGLFTTITSLGHGIGSDK